MKKDKQTEFNCYGDSLQNLIDSFKAAGYTESDFANTELELNYDSCYYEGDTPSIRLIVKK